MAALVHMEKGALFSPKKNPPIAPPAKLSSCAPNRRLGEGGLGLGPPGGGWQTGEASSGSAMKGSRCRRLNRALPRLPPDSLAAPQCSGVLGEGGGGGLFYASLPPPLRSAPLRTSSVFQPGPGPFCLFHTTYAASGGNLADWLGPRQLREPNSPLFLLHFVICGPLVLDAFRNGLMLVCFELDLVIEGMLLSYAGQARMLFMESKELISHASCPCHEPCWPCCGGSELCQQSHHLVCLPRNIAPTTA